MRPSRLPRRYTALSGLPTRGTYLVEASKLNAAAEGRRTRAAGGSSRARESAARPALTLLAKVLCQSSSAAARVMPITLAVGSTNPVMHRPLTTTALAASQSHSADAPIWERQHRLGARPSLPWMPCELPWPDQPGQALSCGAERSSGLPQRIRQPGGIRRLGQGSSGS